MDWICKIFHQFADQKDFKFLAPDAKLSKTVLAGGQLVIQTDFTWIVRTAQLPRNGQIIGTPNTQTLSLTVYANEPTRTSDLCDSDFTNDKLV